VLLKKSPDKFIHLIAEELVPTPLYDTEGDLGPSLAERPVEASAVFYVYLVVDIPVGDEKGGLVSRDIGDGVGPSHLLFIFQRRAEQRLLIFAQQNDLCSIDADRDVEIRGTSRGADCLNMAGQLEMSPHIQPRDASSRPKARIR